MSHVHNYNYEAVRNAEGYLKVDVPNKLTAAIADNTPENGCKDFSGLKLPSCSDIKVNAPMLAQ